MFNVVDLIGILLVTIGAFVAFKRGFVRTFFGFVSTFLAIILAFMFCNPVANIIINQTQIDEWVESKVQITLGVEKKEETEKNTETKQEETENTNVISKFLKDLPNTVQNAVSMEEYKTNTKNALAEKAVGVIIKILAWMIVYLTVRIILAVLCLIFDGIMSIPFLKQINNLAGLALGIILGLFRIYVILAFISFLVSIVPITPVVESINSSLIISAMYQNNLVLKLIF